MDKLVIEGGQPLKGRIKVSGSKNASLPILFASILPEGEVILDNVPALNDISTTLKLLGTIGCESRQEGNRIHLSRGSRVTPEAPYELVRRMRASALCLGPLLALTGHARVALPGGCAIGARPVDQHIKAFERMGARFELESGYMIASCDKLRGQRLILDFPTVGGTENVLMAAALAEGETVIENAAREPEVVDLANFLNACGANICGHGTSVITVQGVASLSGCSYSVMPDRIEAGTFLIAAIITGGELYLESCPFNDLDAVIYKLREMGVWIQEGKTGVLVKMESELISTDVTTLPYPGFPTDMQAQIMALMCLSKGSGVVKETIFENRFMHVPELLRMGANIKISGQSAHVRGVKKLTGAPVMASDLRAGVSLVLAGLAAEGTTEVRRIYHLDRGYERLEEKLSAVGGNIRRVRDDNPI